MFDLKEALEEQKQNLCQRWNKHKRKLFVTSAVLMSAGVSLAIWGTTIRHNSYLLIIQDEPIGIAQTQEELEEALQTVVSQLKEKKGVPIALNETIKITSLHSKKEDLTEEAALFKAIQRALSYEVEGYAILVDGVQEVVVETKEVAEKVLEAVALTQLKEGSTVQLKSMLTTENIVPKALSRNTSDGQATIPYDAVDEVIVLPETTKEASVKERVMVEEVTIPEDEADEGEVDNTSRELKSFDFHQEITLETLYLNESDVMSYEEAVAILLSETEECQEYVLESGDNIWDIAIAHGLSMEHILEINPQIEDERKMQIGEVIKLEIPTPVISMLSVEQATFKEMIPADIEYIEDEEMYKDQTKVVEEGYDGVKEITVLVQKVNGKEVERELLNETILEEAQTKVISYGTKERPKTGQSASVSGAGSGVFMHPLNGGGTLSSTYGSRWGSFHRGLDIAASAGTPIYAAASGTVVFSGYNTGGFGKLIIIDHNNGYQTYYAHCSSLYVQVGQEVSKGENIAGVGSTGNSTGNHVHFEIRQNGTPINPYSYVY